MKIRTLFAALALTLFASSTFARERCPPASYGRAELQTLKAAAFAIADGDARVVIVCLACGSAGVRKR